MPKDRDRKHDPPDRHTQKSHAHCCIGIGQTKQSRLHVPHQVDQQQNPATQIAQCVALGGDAIDLVGARHVRKKRIVKDVGSGISDAGQHVKDHGHEPIALLHHV